MDALEIGQPALAVVDMQNDFVDHDVGSYAIGAERMVTRIGRVIAAARRAQVPIVFSQEVHRADGLDGGRLLWDGRSGWVTGKHPRAAPGAPPAPPCIEGTEGFEIVDELAPEPGDMRILKRRFSIFVGTELDMNLRQPGGRHAPDRRRVQRRLRALDHGRRLSARLQGVRSGGLCGRYQRAGPRGGADAHPGAHQRRPARYRRRRHRGAGTPRRRHRGIGNRVRTIPAASGAGPGAATQRTIPARGCQ